jgi:hypothetical protein
VFDGILVDNALQIGISSPPAVRSFFAFDPASRGGVNVAVGQFRTDGKADIVVGTGTGTATVRVFDGRTTSLLREFDVQTPEQPPGGIPQGGGQPGTTGSLFGGATTGGTPTGLISGGGINRAFGGVRVGVIDRNGDGLSDIITGFGPGTTSRVRIFDGNSVQEINNFLAFPLTFLGGVFVGGNSLTR